MLAGCPGDDTGEDGPADSANSTTDDPTTADSTSSTTVDETDTLPETETAPPDTDTTPPETETDTAPPDTDTDTESDTEGAIPGCECILDEDVVDSSDVPAAPICGEPICPHVSGDCGDNRCDPTVFMLADPDALICALTALRDRSPGIVTWSWSELIGQYDDSGYVLINEDGTAVRRNWGWMDLSYEASDAVLGELPSAEAFDTCLAEPEDYARFNCLRRGLESALGVCDEGWSYDKI
jgi:hypothetical protein